MFSSARQLMLSTVAAAIVMSFAFVAHAWDTPDEKTNINLAVASNFFGVPPDNSAITDLINAFESANPQYTVTNNSRKSRKPSNDRAFQLVPS